MSGQLKQIAIDSPIGYLNIDVVGKVLVRLDINAQPAPEAEDAKSPVRDRLERYLDGELLAIDQIEVGAPGTSFQRAVWAALRDIRCGTTASYAGVAAAIKRPTAFRAVANANARNPIGLVVPCHRVIGTNGKLVGYAGGLWRKEWLLKHEGALLV